MIFRRAISAGTALEHRPQSSHPMLLHRVWFIPASPERSGQCHCGQYVAQIATRSPNQPKSRATNPVW